MNRHLALISQRIRTANTGEGSGISPFVVRFRCDIFLALLAVSLLLVGCQQQVGDWWSGEGPDTSTWRFNLKANSGDATGESFAVNVSNDAGRDDLLLAFVADAQAGRPSKVFVSGRLATFDAPSSDRVRTGLTMDVQSSSDILLEAPSELR